MSQDKIPPQEIWKRRLAALQSLHEEETLQQQREHLSQLHQLQGELLKEIALNMSGQGLPAEPPGAGEGSVSVRSEAWLQGSAVLTDLPDPTLPPLSLSESSEGEIKPGSKILGPRLGQPTVSHTLSPSDSTKPSSATRLAIHYTGLTSHTPSPVRRSSEHSLTEQSPKAISRSQGYHELTGHTPSPSPARAAQTSPHHRHGGYGSHTPSPTHHRAGHTPSPSHHVRLSSPAVQTQHMGVDQFSPVSTRLAPSSTPPYQVGESSTVPHPLTATVTPLPPAQSYTRPLTSHAPQSCPPPRMTEREGVGQSCDLQASRTSLVDKHAKHITDLKEYYESELAVMSEKLAKLGMDSHTPTRRSLNFDTPLRTAAGSGEPEWQGEGGVGDEAKLSDVRSENVMLRTECSKLYKMFQEAKKLCDTLQEQKRRAEGQLLEWQEHSASSEKLVAMLKERLEATRTELRERDVLNQQMQSDLQDMAEDLHVCRTERDKDLEKMDQLISKYEELQLANIRLGEENRSHLSDLEASRTELASLRSSLEEQKTQHISTVRRLEEELSRLERYKNKTHSMGTHYELGYDTTSEVRVLAPSTSYTVKRHSPNHHHHHTPGHSPHHPAGHTHITPPSHKGQQQPATKVTPTTTPTTTAAERQLTKRKWLQSSDPGLFGGSSPSPPSTSGGRNGVTRGGAPRKTTSSSSPGGKVTRTPEKRGGTRQQVSSAALARLGQGEVDCLTDAVLQAIREGRISTGESMEQKVKRHTEVVAEAEHKLDKLLQEKDKLESALQRTPRPGVRVNRQAKQQQLDKERKLEQVVHEIGSVRMLLRKHNALSSSSGSRN